MQIKTVVTMSKEDLMEALQQYLKPHVTISEGSTIEMGTIAEDGSVEVTISSGLGQVRKNQSTTEMSEKASPEPQEAKKEVEAPTPLPTGRSPSRSLFQNLTKVSNQ